MQILPCMGPYGGVPRSPTGGGGGVAQGPGSRSRGLFSLLAYGFPGSGVGRVPGLGAVPVVVVVVVRPLLLVVAFLAACMPRAR